MLPARRLAAGNFRLRRRRQISQTATAASAPALIAGMRLESPDEPDPPPSDIKPNLEQSKELACQTPKRLHQQQAERALEIGDERGAVTFIDADESGGEGVRLRRR